MSLFKETTEGFKNEYFFLSNMYPVTLYFDDKEFNSSEHIYQYLKALSVSEELANKVLHAETPHKSKRIMNGIDVPVDIKLYAMDQALKTKFVIKSLVDQLLLTNDVELVEYNTWGDAFLGQSYSKRWFNRKYSR